MSYNAYRHMRIIKLSRQRSCFCNPRKLGGSTRSAQSCLGVSSTKAVISREMLHIITSIADELSGGTSIDDLERNLNPKIWVLVIFSRFVAATHNSRVNCVEITGHRQRQPANEIFSINRRL